MIIFIDCIQCLAISSKINKLLLYPTSYIILCVLRYLVLAFCYLCALLSMSKLNVEYFCVCQLLNLFLYGSLSSIFVAFSAWQYLARSRSYCFTSYQKKKKATALLDQLHHPLYSKIPFFWHYAIYAHYLCLN